jgi:hypothetical protein
MARGWESKSVESQVEDKNRRESGSARRQASTAEARARAERKGTLELARARLRADFSASKVPAHRTMLQEALAALDREIAALDGPAGS